MKLPTLIRAMLCALALLPLPTAAQDVGANEAQVMRLIFDDCLGFVTDGTEPFTDMEANTLTRDEQQRLGLFGDQNRSARLINNGTYIAMWGKTEDMRSCVIATGERQILAPQLIVRKEDFIAQMTLRAGALGLGVGAGNPKDDGLRSWVEPGVLAGEGLTIFLQFDIAARSAGLDTFGVVMPVPDLLN